MTQRRTGRTGGVSGLAAGSAVAGLLAYVFFATVTRTLGGQAAAPVSVLWTYWGFTGAAVTFPLQHWIARTVTADGGEGGVRRQLPGVLAAVLAVGLVAGTLSWLAADRLFGVGGPVYPLFVVVVTLGAALMGVLRGLLTARRRFGAVGAGLVAENAVRCLAALAAVAAGRTDHGDAVWYAGCLVLGYAAALAWPAALVPRQSEAARGRTGTHPRDGAPDPARSAALAFLGAAAVGQLLGQAVLTGGPVLLALAGGAATSVTALFAGLALFRAPYTLGLGVLAPVTERLTRMVVDGRGQALRRVLAGLTGATAVLALAGAGVGALLGPPLVRGIFAADLHLTGLVCALVAAGTVLAIGNLVLTLMMMALDRAHATVAGWLVALVPGAAWFLLSGADLTTRTAATFTVVEGAATVALVLAAASWLGVGETSDADR